MQLKRWWESGSKNHDELILQNYLRGKRTNKFDSIQKLSHLKFHNFGRSSCKNKTKYKMEPGIQYLAKTSEDSTKNHTQMILPIALYHHAKNQKLVMDSFRGHSKKPYL